MICRGLCFASYSKVLHSKCEVLLSRHYFFRCYDLKTVKVAGTSTAFGDNAFGSCSSSLTFSCYSGSTAAAYASSNGYKTSYLSATLSKPTISKATNTSGGIKLTWAKISNASGYYVYRKSGTGSYKKIKTITGASTVTYTDTAVKNKDGTKYTYKIVAYNGNTTSAAATKTTYRLKGVSLSGVTNASSKKIKVKWSSTTKVTGYQIQYSTSSSFASGNKTKKISGASKKTYTLSGLTKGKTYYVRIRTYKTVNGKTYYFLYQKS
ncbi:MAG: fibronectin type III domain-containing protein [Lachnospiraceae bacterium]|nr:fibronectin type III domain-containing protein [Lachnospiraceae bacterium]